MNDVAPSGIQVRTTCPYCGVGCGVVIRSEGERIIGVHGDVDHPANFGRLCTKGATLHLSASFQDTRPRDSPRFLRSSG